MTRFRKAALLVLPLVLGSAACSDPELVSPTLDGASYAKVAAPEAGSQDLESTWLVRFRGQADLARFGKTISELGGEVIFAHADAGVAAVSGLSPVKAFVLSKRAEIAGVDADAFVELKEVDASLVEAADAPESPTNPAGAAFYGRQWNMKAISANSAWTEGKLGSSSVKVGILDTGIDYLHPDLVGRVDLALSRSFLSAAENARVPAGFHPVADLNYHGTHVAVTVSSNGLIAAGVNSRVKLVGLKVCAPGSAPNYQGTCPTSGTLGAILYAADNGIPIINMSLGGTFNRRQASAAGGFGPSFLATINQVMNYAHRKGTTVVVSAGNSALDIDHDGNGYKSYCSAAQVICASATGPTAAGLYATPAYPRLGEYLNILNIDALAYYSNYGRSAINVAAPGGNTIPVWAACSGFTIHPALVGCGSRFYDPGTGAYSGSVVGLAGTSMAAPHVAGLLALIASEIGTTQPAALRAALEQSADDLGQPGTDPAYGKGRINVARAMGL